MGTTVACRETEFGIPASSFRVSKCHHADAAFIQKSSFGKDIDARTLKVWRRRGFLSVPTRLPFYTLILYGHVRLHCQ